MEVSGDHVIDMPNGTDNIAFTLRKGHRSAGLAFVVTSYVVYGIDVAQSQAGLQFRYKQIRLPASPCKNRDGDLRDGNSSGPRSMQV